MLTTEQLLAVMPNAGARAAAFTAPLADAMHEFQINTPHRVAAFLAQVAHESGELRWLRELSDGLQYEGRLALGNSQPGDGPRYKGRGLLQATGRAQYEKIGRALGLDLIDHPELLEEPAPASRSAGWIWAIEKNLNPPADLDEFAAITQRINGGFNGIDSRIKYWLRGREIEGL
jgi:putative chitinase